MGFMKDFFSKSTQSTKESMEASNGFFGGMQQRFENRKFECFKTGKDDHHLVWLGKQAATVLWDVGRGLYDVVDLFGMALGKGVMKLCRYTPTSGPFHTMSERSLLRQTGELLGDVGAVSWDGLLLMKSTAISACKLVGYACKGIGYVGKGVGYAGKGVGHIADWFETHLHFFSDKKSTETTVRYSDLQKRSSDHQDANHLAHDMSNAPKEQVDNHVISEPCKVMRHDSNTLQLLRTTAPGA